MVLNIYIEQAEGEDSTFGFQGFVLFFVLMVRRKGYHGMTQNNYKIYFAQIMMQSLFIFVSDTLHVGRGRNIERQCVHMSSFKS